MSKWCNTCYRNEATGEWEPCDQSCPVFGMDFEDMAKRIIAASMSDEDLLPSGCLYIHGYLTTDYDGILSVKNDDSYWSHGDSIIAKIESYAERNGFVRKKQTGLGGTQTFIRNCNMRAFFTENETTLAQAQLLFDAQVYGGDLVTDTSLCGYSEWTITGMDLDEFTIGGHDLKNEFSSHMGEYVHLIIECE